METKTVTLTEIRNTKRKIQQLCDDSRGNSGKHTTLIHRGGNYTKVKHLRTEKVTTQEVDAIGRRGGRTCGVCWDLTFTQMTSVQSTTNTVDRSSSLTH